MQSYIKYVNVAKPSVACSCSKENGTGNYAKHELNTPVFFGILVLIIVAYFGIPKLVPEPQNE